MKKFFLLLVLVIASGIVGAVLYGEWESRYDGLVVTVTPKAESASDVVETEPQPLPDPVVASSEPQAEAEPEPAPEKYVYKQKLYSPRGVSQVETRMARQIPIVQATRREFSDDQERRVIYAHTPEPEPIYVGGPIAPAVYMGGGNLLPPTEFPVVTENIEYNTGSGYHRGRVRWGHGPTNPGFNRYGEWYGDRHITQGQAVQFQLWKD